MYYLEDREGNSMNVFIDQFSLVEDQAIGFMSAIGSRTALEEVRHRLLNLTYGSVLRIRQCGNNNTHICSLYGGYQRYYRFFFRKLDNAPYWTMTIVNKSVLNSCQDLVRGIQLSEDMRKRESKGRLWYNLPIYFLFRGSDLFDTDEAMRQFMETDAASKENILWNNPVFVDMVYRKITSCSRLPFLQEWMPALLSLNSSPSNPTFVKLSVGGFLRQHEEILREDKIFTFRITFDEDDLQSLIIRAFTQGMISTGSDVRTGTVMNTNTLTDYLNQFSDHLIQKANDRFNPLYTPGISRPSQKAQDFFTNTKYFSDLDYFSAQQDVICSVTKGLTRNKRALIVGECGIGKTAIALASIYIHSQKKNPVSMVMCPGHMVEKWKTEIQRLYPFAQAYIIERLSQLSRFEAVIRSKKAAAPLFLIFGKDSCKMDYDQRPYMHWDDKQHCYILPNKKKLVAKGVSSMAYPLERYAEHINFFLKPNKKNQDAVLLDVQESYNKKVKTYFTVDRNSGEKNRTKLWTAASSDNEEWVKIAKVGWVNKILAQKFIERVDRATASGKEMSKTILKAYDIASAALGEEIAKPLIRCNISDYICRRMKNCIDYFIADEVHLYSSNDTAQGKAFSNMVNTARYTIALTGTLLNGYAENVFSMLFKLYSRAFVRNGFSYHDSREFAKEYGVVDTVREYTVEHSAFNGRRYERLDKTTTKYKPGISPLLFSKFLLDKAVFVTLADITSDLPNYHEEPIGVDMDPDAAAGYRQFFNSFRNALREHESEKEAFLLKSIKRLNMYPDQPYNQVPVFNNETGEQIFCPPSISRRSDTVYASNKDKKLLELIQKHKENGEKVLVYVHWVHKLDCVERIQKILEDNRITSAFLTSSVSARGREKWIADKMKENIDVLICNPNLVKEGLDLLDFTTIIFYQMDDKLFTLRQASRRSMRLNQSKDVTVYILYFKDTVQENIICLMANKLQAAMAIEGKFSEEGLNALSDTDSILTQLANNLTKDIDMKLEAGAFDFHTIQAQTSGNRFKGNDYNIMENWLYKIDAAVKKKPKEINIDEDLKLLRTGS